MKDIFLGFYYEGEKEAELLKNSTVGISTAANQYQTGFLEGLGKETCIISTLSVGAFPKRNRKLFYKRENKRVAYGDVTYLPFINLHGIKDMMFSQGIYRELAKIIRAQSHTTVYVYSLNVVFERVLKRLKRKFGDKFTYCLIIPDLPGAYGIVRKGIKGIKDRMDAKPKMQNASFADCYVFLTEAMRELFPPRPYVVIEGFLPTEQFDYSNTRIPKTILYTGTLNGKFGIQTLLDAFALIKDEQYRLWICGAGGIEQKIVETAQKDHRIEFKGFLPKKEISKLQTQCDVLINPRPAEGVFTKYSFPSKTMEYLLSGSKVLMYRLPGIGDEYFHYVRELSSVDPKEMAEKIVEACSDASFYEMPWMEQVQWIQNQKNATRQLEKLTRLLAE